LGIGDWGLGIGDWGLGPIPNPQSPIPNPPIRSHPKINSLIEERLNTQYQQNLTDYLTEEDCLKKTGLIFLNHCISHCKDYNIEKTKEYSDDALLFMKKFFRIVVAEDNDKINSLVEDPKCLKNIHLIFIQLRDTIVNKK
jgi:hypothetical protein